jgi:hypothetical protein
MQPRVLVFDPGETTGWSFLFDGYIEGGSFKLWYSAEELIDTYMPSVILYESFNLCAGTAHRLIGNQFLAVQVIGVIRYLADKRNILCTSQPPNMRMGITLVRMQGFDKHAKDAVRHGIRYLLKQNSADLYTCYRLHTDD